MGALTSEQEAPGVSGKTLLRWLADAWQSAYFGAMILVLVLSPSSYGPRFRPLLARHIYQDTAPILLGFTLLSALASFVLTRIVVATAQSYGLSQYALQVVIRMLVLELIPLTAALFVALRCTLPAGAALAGMQRQGGLETYRQAGQDPVRREVLPRVVAGIFSTLTLAALSCVVALVLAYLAVYGFTLAGLPAYTRQFGQVFSPAVVLVFALKVLFFSLAVSLMPMVSVLFSGSAGRTSTELRGMVRMFVLLLLIEVVSLLANYY